MKAKLHSTQKIVRINGQPCRVWEGTTDKGVPMIAFIFRVAAEIGYDHEEFEADLLDSAPPSPGADYFPAVMVFED